MSVSDELQGKASVISCGTERGYGLAMRTRHQFLWGVVGLFVACGNGGGAPEKDDADSVCDPGETNICSGVEAEGVCEGVQICEDDGSAWGECVCASGDGDAAGDGDVAGDGGAEGDGDAAGDGGENSSGGSDAGGSGGTVAMGGANPACQAYGPERTRRFSTVHADASDALRQMDLDEKVAMLSGGEICPFKDCDFEATGVPSQGIAEMRMRDGTRGVHTADGAEATTFAVAMARAASFDTDLEQRVGEMIGEEMRALRLDLLRAPRLSVLYHPRFGQSQETYGEDPFLAGKMGAAFIHGAQNHVPTCPLALVANISGDNRETMSADMDEQTLREGHARAFEIAIKEGDPGCVVAGYNLLNSVHATEDPFLLTDLLRDDWGFSGFVTSEAWATTPLAGAATLNAGLDLEMPDESAFTTLSSDVDSGDLTTTRIDEAALRVLNVRAHFGQLAPDYNQGSPDLTLVEDEDHIVLARETAEKGAVLLKNDGILPISDTVSSILIMGPDASVPNPDTLTEDVPHGLGDRGGSNTYPPAVRSFFEGIAARAAESSVAVDVSSDPADAASADLIIIPVAMAHEDEGEAFGGGGDRVDLTLSGAHPAHWNGSPATFIEQVAAVNPNVVVVLAVGGAVIVEDFLDDVRALVQTFYPGQEGGTALASLLFGDLNFHGRLPFTVGTSESQYPYFGNDVDAVEVGYLHGYKKFDTESITPRYWFGYGLSYTTFAYTDLRILCDGVDAGGALVFELTVQNTGDVRGTEIVQAYVGYPNTAARRPKKELVGFQPVSLDPGESKTVSFVVPVSDFSYFEEGVGWQVEPLEHELSVASSSDPAAENRLLATFSVN